MFKNTLLAQQLIQKFMKSSLSALLVLLSIIVLSTSCSDPTLIGSDLLEEDQVNIGVIDTISIRTYTEPYDSIQTYSPFESSQLNSYIIGKMTDLVFGETESVLYAQLLLETLDLDLTNISYDSLVLVLPIDSLATYGTQPQEYGFEVRRINEDLDSDLDVYSDQTFAVDETVIGSFLGSFNPFVDKPVFNPDVDSIEQVRQLRIRMDDGFATELIQQDSSTFRTDEAFTDYLKGIQVKATNETNGILGFNLDLAAAGMQLYYKTDGDTTAKVFNFEFQVEGVRALNFSHDYSESVVAEFISKPELGDSLFFLQGTAGLQAIVELPYITDLEGIIVNRAELQIPVSGIDSEYALPRQILASDIDADGNTSFIDDVVFSGINLATLFGGVVVDGTNNGADYYSFNISDHLQDMINGDASNRLIFTVFPEAERASRVIFNGAKHSEPVRLSVTFTRL